MKQHSTLVALVTAAVTFVAMFALLGQANDMIRLIGPAVLAVCAAGGTKLMLTRSAAEITDHAYQEDARGQMRACMDLVEQIKRSAKQVRSASMQREVGRIGQVVPDLLRRVERTAPSSLYSSASQMRAHLESLDVVVRTFVDIERNPSYYDHPDQQLVQGEQAVRRFVDFAIDSIKLVNQGDMAAYKANLETVAPPEIPSLDLGPQDPNPTHSE